MHIANTPWQIASSPDDDVHRMISIVDRKTCRGVKVKRADGGRLDPDPGDDCTITWLQSQNWCVTTNLQLAWSFPLLSFPHSHIDLLAAQYRSVLRIIQNVTQERTPNLPSSSRGIRYLKPFPRLNSLWKDKWNIQNTMKYGYNPSNDGKT